MKSIFLGFLLFICICTSAQKISFEQSWQRLLKVSDQLKAKTEELNRIQSQNKFSRDMHLPDINIMGGYTYMEKSISLDLNDLNPIGSIDPATLPPGIAQLLSTIPHSAFVTPFTEQDIFRSSLQAMWPIYTGGKISAAQAIQKAQASEQVESLELSKRHIFIQLVDRYYAISLTKSLMNTQLQLMDSLNNHLQQAIALENQGQIAQVERLNAQVAFENARVNYGNAKRQHEMARIALTKMLHESIIDTSSELFVLNRLMPLSEINQLTLQQHPALKLLQAKEAQAHGLINIEKSNYLPQVFLYGNYTLYKDDQLLSKIEPDWIVGVGVKIPIMSNNGRKGKMKAAKSALLQAGYSKAQTRQDLELLIDQSYRQLQQAEEEVKALNTSLSLAKENLRLRKLSFTQGLSTSIEQVDAEIKLQAVQTQQIAAKYHYVQAYARLMSVSGQIQQFITSTQFQETGHAVQ